MQTPTAADDVRLSFYLKDSGSLDRDDCAAFYRTNRRTWVVQGERRGERVARQLHALKPSETFVEIPETLVEPFVRMYVKDHYGIDLGGAA